MTQIGPASIRKHIRAWCPRLVTLLALALVSTPARATTLLVKEFSALCAEADVIFVGTVTGVRSQWTDANHRGIETLVTFEDLSLVHGSVTAPYTLRFGGGEVDDIREDVAGVPRFTAGQRVVLFVRQSRSVSPIIGFNQGYFQVIDGPRSPIVLNGDGHAVLGVRNDRIETAPTGSGTDSAIPLATFLETVRQQLTTRGSGS